MRTANRPRGILGYFAEVVLIVLGVALGLAANEWRIAKERRRDAHLALVQIRGEVVRNGKRCDRSAEYHAIVRDSLQAFILPMIRGVRTIDDFYRLRASLPHGFQVPLLQRTAWDAALRTGVLSSVDPDVLVRLSRYYAMIDFAQGKIDKVSDNLYDATNMDPSHWRGLVIALRDIVNDLVIQERRLVASSDSLATRLPRR